MMDNLGDITAHYMADFHQTLASDKEGENVWLPEVNGIPLPVTAEGGDGVATVEQWFELLGHDEGAMNTAWAVSKGMMYGEVATASQEEQWKSESEEAIGIHAQLTAALTAGGLDGVADDIDADADEHNDKIDLYAKAAGFGINLAGANPVNSTLASEGMNLIFNDLKTDAGEVYQHVTADQSRYYEQVRSDFPQDATQAAIVEILSDDGHDSELVVETSSQYSSEYERLVRRYLSGQDDEAERHMN